MSEDYIVLKVCRRCGVVLGCYQKFIHNYTEQNCGGCQDVVFCAYRRGGEMLPIKVDDLCQDCIDILLGGDEDEQETEEDLSQEGWEEKQAS